MFTNPSLGDIYLVSGRKNVIHLASALSHACSIDEEENGRFGILPCANDRERELMLRHFACEFPELQLCAHCFARELRELWEHARGKVDS